MSNSSPSFSLLEEKPALGPKKVSAYQAETAGSHSGNTSVNRSSVLELRFLIAMSHPPQCVGEFSELNRRAGRA